MCVGLLLGSNVTFCVINSWTDVEKRSVGHSTFIRSNKDYNLLTSKNKKDPFLFSLVLVKQLNINEVFTSAAFDAGH